jgi:hypothetical protein
MKAEKVIFYVCESCGTEYEEMEEAEDCCIPEVSEIEKWKCGECWQIYDDKDKTMECCK